MEGARIGPYRVLGDLGSGGMGKVYLAEVEGEAAGLDGGTRVALKLIHPHLLETPGFFKRFLREAEIGRSVEQDNVVQCYDCDATLVDGASQHFLVMEYVEGQTLRDLLNELERVPEELCRHIGREIAKGLVAIHEAGVIHRDLKPENVLITEEHVVKVMDLGVARLQDEVVRLSQTGAFVGSLEYACPEQFRGGGAEVDARSDLHALGVMLYELATGQHPYRTDDTSSTIHNVIEGQCRRAGEVNPQLSPFFEEVVHTLAAKEPGDRFASASLLLEVLEGGEKSDWWKERANTLRIETKRPLRRIRIPRETALYGREDDLAKLHVLYEKTKAGDGQVLLIEGEAGIGKTRLVDEFVGRLRKEGEDIHFLFGSYPPGGAATAAGAFSTAFREQFGPGGAGAYLAITPILVPAFEALLRGEPPPKGEESLTKDSLQTVFIHATRGLATERTTLILIDDLHFAPEEGRALFASLSLAIPGHRVLLLGTMRPGVPEDWIANVERQEHAARMVLPRLGAKDLSLLLEDAFHSRRLAEELGIQIARKSDGNPFFVFEIIRGLREGQFITQEPDGQWVTTQVIEDIKVPSSVLDLVNARVADLLPEERDLLDVASCSGFAFDPLVVGEAAGLGRIPALKRLAQVERRHRLVRASGRTYVFDHHQVQEALYGILSDPLREEYHSAIARAMEVRTRAADANPEDLNGSLCVDLCEHYLKGGNGVTALRYLDAALDELERGYLNDQAIALADRALACPHLLTGSERSRLLLRKVDRLHLLGRRQDQERAILEARQHAEAANDHTYVNRAGMALGRYYLAVSQLRAAREEFAKVCDAARAASDQAAEVAARGNLALVLRREGKIQEAQAQFEECLSRLRELGDRERMVIAHGNLGGVLVSQGEWASGRAHYQKQLDISREIGDRRGEVRGTGNLAVLHYIQGRLAETQEYLLRSLHLSREIGDRWNEALAIGNLGGLLGDLGQMESARSHCLKSLAIVRELGDLRGEASAMHHLAVVDEAEKNIAGAETRYREALALRRDMGQVDGVALTLVALGSLFARQAKTQDALPLLEESLRLAREIGDTEVQVLAAAHIALIRPDDAQLALKAFEAAKDRLGHNESAEARFSLWQATSDRAHLHEAKRLLDYRVEHAPEAYRESMLKNVRLNREIMEAWAELGGEGE